MTEKAQAPEPLGVRLEALRIVYDEVCRAHDGIAEFRSKLLALLPIASGAGIFLLLGITQESRKYLLAIGVFGALVTLGLYLYELRGIQKCNVLTQCGKTIEKELLGNPDCRGTFTDDPPPAFRFVGSTWAARIIYPATMGAWTFVGLCEVLSPAWHYGLAGIAVLAFGAFGWSVDSWQNKQLKDRLTKACS